MGLSLEQQPQRQLHPTRIPRPHKRAERATGLPSLLVEPGRRIYTRELRMIEAVVPFRAELQLEALPGQPEILEQRNVPVIDAGAAEHVLGLAQERFDVG